MALKRKWVDICISVILVTVLPCFLFSLIGDPDSEIPIEQEMPAVTTQELDAAEEICIDVLLKTGKVHSMELNDYLTSVVLCEMPATFETEALKAQAVVARTYTLRRKDGNKKHENAAVCTDPSCCQGFCAESAYLSGGGTQEMLEKVRNAVITTSDEVLMYEGALIEATYFSCSGGQTEDAKAVWGTDIPYLQSRESPGEENATHYSDTVKFSVAEFKAQLDIHTDKRPEQWVEHITYTNGGGVDTIRLCGREYKGTELRKKLDLRSTAFIITAIGDTVTITTKGYGHRVGMSQYGADAMAVQGYNYAQILSHYYPGTKLVSFHSDGD